MSHDQNAGCLLSFSQIVIIKECYFYNNSNLNGGAIYFNKYANSDKQYFTIEKTLFFKNQAGETGSAIYFDNAIGYIIGNITESYFLQQYSFYGKIPYIYIIFLNYVSCCLCYDKL